MEKCLVVKLKSVVGDDTLTKLGEVKIHYSGTDSTLSGQYFLAQYSGTENNGVKISGGHFYTLDGTKIEDTHITGKTSYEYLVENGAIVTIGNKYDSLNTLCVGDNAELNLADVKYCLNIYRFGFGALTYGDLNNLSMLSNCGTFGKTGNTYKANIAMYGDIASLNDNCPSLPFFGYSKVVGDIKDIGSKYLALAQKHGNMNLAKTGCYGTIESMVQAFRERGLSSGYLGNYNNFECNDGVHNVTFGGVVVTYGETYGDKKISWTETTITYGDITVNA